MYIVFIFLFVCSSICMFIHSFVLLLSRQWNVEQSFKLKFLKWGISHQPHIRKHSYLDHRYPGGSAFIPWLLTPGFMSQGGARGKNLGHLYKVFFYFSVIETTYESSWSNMAQPCDTDLWAYMWTLPDHPGASRKCSPTPALPRVRQNLPDVKIQKKKK